MQLLQRCQLPQQTCVLRLTLQQRFSQPLYLLLLLLVVLVCPAALLCCCRFSNEGSKRL